MTHTRVVACTYQRAFRRYAYAFNGQPCTRNHSSKLKMSPPSPMTLAWTCLPPDTANTFCARVPHQHLTDRDPVAVFTVPRAHRADVDNVNLGA
jgi:hypothetical protein